MRVNNGTIPFVNLISNHSPFQGSDYFPFLNKDGDFLRSEYIFGGKDVEGGFNLGVISQSFLVYLCGRITHVDNPKNDEYVKGSFVGFLARLKFLPFTSPKTKDGNSSFDKISTSVLLTVEINGKCSKYLSSKIWTLANQERYIWNLISIN